MSARILVRILARILARILRRILRQVLHAQHARGSRTNERLLLERLTCRRRINIEHNIKRGALNRGDATEHATCIIVFVGGRADRLDRLPGHELIRHAAVTNAIRRDRQHIAP